ncbi:MAG: hypothetical protein JST85_28340 [Acidobacteria bacterium]|nr:hypothetical protein [Acidobacteriota bacterium]
MIGNFSMKVGEVFGNEIVRESAKRLFHSGDMASEPSTAEISSALGENATPAEEKAYCEGHRSGWGKGLVIGGLIVLAGVAALAFASKSK